MKKEISRIIQINEANELPAARHSSQPKKKWGGLFPYTTGKRPLCRKTEITARAV